MTPDIPPDCQDLIRRMLQTNPVKRIKMGEIKQHRWYQQDLPEYLQQMSKNPLKHLENVIDRELVRHLMQVSKSWNEWVVVSISERVLSVYLRV